MPTLTNLVSFNGANGAYPDAGLTADANGDLFGTTNSGGANGDGTVFELVNTASGYSLSTLASFNGANGSGPNGLTEDANGDLFGTTMLGGGDNLGTVFELVNTGVGYSLTTLTIFNGANGQYPVADLVADANGDLFGTTDGGGANGDGTVFELVNTGSGYSFTTLTTFNDANGAFPQSGLIADAHGDLFGTTVSGESGGLSDAGTVFELVNTGSGCSLTTLATFNGANGAYPQSGLIADARGDLFGTTNGAGFNDGTVFELVNTGAGYSLTTLISFNGANGAHPIAGLIADANGDLFGTTQAGGANGYGTVFELVNTGSGYSLSTLASFNVANGALPVAGLTVDANGDLFGTAEHGGANSYGTVFEVITDNDMGEQAALGLSVNGGSTTPIGHAGAGAVAFSVAGLDAEDTGVVTFSDGTHQVTFDVTGGTTGYSANLSTLTDGPISSALQVATDSAGNSFTAVAGNSIPLDQDAGEQAAVSFANQIIDLAQSKSETFTVSGLAPDDFGSVVFSDGIHSASVQIANGAAVSATVNLSSLNNGLITATVTAHDTAGNTFSASAQATLDQVALVPSMTDVVKDTMDSLTTLSGFSEPNSSVKIYDGKVLVGTAIADSSGAWSFKANVTGASIHSYTETATDLAGNTGSSLGMTLFNQGALESLKGGAGNDFLIGGPNDSLTGGGGHDSFVFNPAFGKETITDFNVNTDVLLISHLLFSGATQALAHAINTKAGAEIIYDHNDFILLTGVSVAQLQAHPSDFHIF